MRRYWIFLQILRLFALAVLIVYFYSVIQHPAFRLDILVVFFVALAVYFIIRTAVNERIERVLTQKCEPARALSLYAAICNIASFHRWSPYLYNVASALYYDGRFEEVKTVIQIMRKYERTDFDRALAEILSCKIAHHERDRQAMSEHIAILRPLGDQTHLYGRWQHLYYEILEYWDLMNLEAEHSYKKLYSKYMRSESYSGTMLNEVKRNYHLALIAHDMNDSVKAEKHRAFVLKNGGTLWYKRQLEKGF